MDTTVFPCSRLDGEWHAPPSKNFSTRLILAASLARGESVIRGAADNDDARSLVRCLTAMGASFERRDADLHVVGTGGELRSPAGDLDVGNAGAVCRFLLALAPLAGRARFVTRHEDSLGSRPHSDLLAALKQLGVKADSRNGRLPIEVTAGSLTGGEVSVNGSVSSQYLSGLLFLAPLLPQGLQIRVQPPLRSPSAVLTTLDVLNRMGIRLAASSDLLHFTVPGGQHYQSGDYRVPGDYPAAAAVACACALVPSEVRLMGLQPDCQGERYAFLLLERMGLRVRTVPGGMAISGDGRALEPVECEGDELVDAVLSVATAATRARGVSRFRNLANLRLKESDRISDFRREMERLGARIDEGSAEMTIWGQPSPSLSGMVHVFSHHDHRLVMALTAAALASPCITVLHDSHEVAKSYPHFFADFSALGARFSHTGPPMEHARGNDPTSR